MSEKKETYKLFNLPWYYFAVFAVVILLATYTGSLPKGMSGCFAFMIVLGTILYEIGERWMTAPRFTIWPAIMIW